MVRRKSIGSDLQRTLKKVDRPSRARRLPVAWWIFCLSAQQQQLRIIGKLQQRTVERGAVGRGGNAPGKHVELLAPQRDARLLARARTRRQLYGQRRVP